jgi:hypothetical protein
MTGSGVIGLRSLFVVNSIAVFQILFVDVYSRFFEDVSGFNYSSPLERDDAMDPPNALRRVAVSSSVFT